MRNWLRYLWAYIRSRKISFHHYSGIEDYFSFTFKDGMKLYLFLDRNYEAVFKSLNLKDAKVAGIFLSLLVKDKKLKHVIVTKEDNGIWPESDQKLLAFSYLKPLTKYLKKLYTQGFSHPNLSNEELVPVIENCDGIYERLKRSEFRPYDKIPSIVDSFTWRIGLE